ncbi:uncharacterized protein LOC127428336 isoform X2 [Myxocyprinus asiaticus]|uniref:uncharacterized protein LOC127428336 isoform X2 n=1 Tax=Myxocyprinus asiaticus TaxID=70543 RepID=UPI0022223028|nr:uncharacterized protein LOC127428336 isoform X2 [Myxocyprinus asiaticus]
MKQMRRMIKWMLVGQEMRETEIRRKMQAQKKKEKSAEKGDCSSGFGPCHSRIKSVLVCNHIFALLFQTAHYSELDVQVVPPVHSCTETEQQWHKPRTAKYTLQGLGWGPT